MRGRRRRSFIVEAAPERSGLEGAALLSAVGRRRTGPSFVELGVRRSAGEGVCGTNEGGSGNAQQQHGDQVREVVAEGSGWEPLLVVNHTTPGCAGSIKTVAVSPGCRPSPRLVISTGSPGASPGTESADILCLLHGHLLDVAHDATCLGQRCPVSYPLDEDHWTKTGCLRMTVYVQ